MPNTEKYLDPPDEPEEELCPDCGQPMERSEYTFSGGYKSDVSHSCKNIYCPAKHTGLAADMAEKLLELMEVKERLEKRVKFLAYKIQALEFQRDEKA